MHLIQLMVAHMSWYGEQETGNVLWQLPFSSNIKVLSPLTPTAAIIVTKDTFLQYQINMAVADVIASSIFDPGMCDEHM